MRYGVQSRLAVAATLAVGLIVVPDTAPAAENAGTSSRAEKKSSSESGKSSDGEEEGANDVTETGESERGRQYKIVGEVTTEVGQGTFVGLKNETGETAPKYAASNETAFDRAQMTFRLEPSYKLKPFEFSATFEASQWLTQGGGLNGPAEFRFQDTLLTAEWMGTVLGNSGVQVLGGAEFSFPTNQVSQAASKIVGTSLYGLVQRRFFKRLALAYQIAGGKNFHRFESPRVDLSKVGSENVLFREGGSERLGGGKVAIGNLNTEWTMTHVLFGQISIVKNLSASVEYAYQKAWTYHVQNGDQFSSVNADTGRGSQDLISTSVYLTYKVNRYLSFSGGTSTVMPPKTNDNKSFRFPFWNLQGAANNFSSITFSVTGTY